MDTTAAPMQQGHAAAARRDWGAAIAHYARATQAAPGDATAWIALSKAHDVGGSHRASRDAAVRAAALDASSWGHATTRATRR